RAPSAKAASMVASPRRARGDMYYLLWREEEHALVPPPGCGGASHRRWLGVKGGGATSQESSIGVTHLGNSPATPPPPSRSTPEARVEGRGHDHDDAGEAVCRNRVVLEWRGMRSARVAAQSTAPDRSGFRKGYWFAFRSA